MTQPLPEINPLLKQLRLNNIMDNLSQRNREAIEHKLAYPEFLALLLQDEILCRENKRLMKRIKRAGFRGDKTLENFNFDFNPKINRAQIQELATCRFINESSPVLIAGPTGTGKSHLAQALGHCAIRLGYDVLWLSQTQLFSELQAAKALDRYHRKMNELCKIPLLIMDDFALKPLRSPQDEDFHDLIAGRYESAGLIVTSNLDFSEWGEAFPNRLLGAATLDRMKHNAYRIILEGASYRAARETKTTPKSTKKPEGK